jgi:cytochrome o ubiquinol oxidase subunit I
MPLYVLGLMGMTRRMQHYSDLRWQPYLIVAEIGAFIIFAGILATIAQVIVSVRSRARRRDATGDPWDGRTLEWSVSSPPPAYNFAVLPTVESRDAFWTMKQAGPRRPADRYEPIEIPPNSANGFVTAFFAVITGFSLIWHIWWLAIVGLLCAVVTLLVFGWMERREVEIPGHELAAAERARLEALGS